MVNMDYISILPHLDGTLVFPEEISGTIMSTVRLLATHASVENVSLSNTICIRAILCSFQGTFLYLN